MVTRTLSPDTLQQRLAALQQQRLKLETQRDQELLAVLHKTQAHNIDLLTLTGLLLAASNTVQENPSQAEVWHQTGEKFLYPKRAAKAANLTKASAQNHAAAQAS